MSGHSHWATIKHKKGAADAKKGKLFSKIARLIILAARQGGGDPKMNLKLQYALDEARSANMPKDNVERAIKRGTGEGGDAATLEELVYEGYAPGGVAVLIEAATDNKNRTAQDLRMIFSRNHGNLASSGSVSYLFKRKGQITVPKSAVDEDQLLEAALEAGAEDVSADEEHHIVTTAHDQLYAVGEALRKAGIEPDAQKLTYIPDTAVQITDESTAAQVIRLCEALEDNDDVQSVHANFDAPEAVLARAAG